MNTSQPVDPSLVEEVKRLRLRVLELESRELESERTRAELDTCTQLAMLNAEVSMALIQAMPFPACLQRCAQALVNHLGAAFARIWTLNQETQVLELVASAGLYTHLNGPHGRVPVGMFKIGRIAANRQPHLTNMVVGDPEVSDQEWARREGMIAFAGYPLLVNDEVVGVIALFAKLPLTPAVLDALASVANMLALGIERKHMEEERAAFLLAAQQAATQAEREHIRLLHILDNLTDAFMIFDEEWRYTYSNPQARLYTGKAWHELLGKKLWDEFPTIRGSLFDEKYHEAVNTRQPVVFEIFTATFSAWFEVHAYPIPDGLAVYFRNITARKREEEERTHLWQLAESARNEAEAALQVRNDFLSSVSHDLKTPIAVMKGNIQLLQRRLKRAAVLDPTWATERLAVMEASTTKMNGMVEDLLTVAKLQTGQKMDLDLVPLSLLPLLDHVCKEQQQTTRRHSLHLQSHEENVKVFGDPIRLDRVFTNLLANAIKYSPAGGLISIELACVQESDQRWATVSIQDEGMGIPEADLPSIFQPFYRATNARGHIQGTGVGLASVAQVLSEHGGTITVSSKEGQGSRFLVALPTLTN